MDAGKRRTGGRTSVVAGSVWDSRMKLDEVKGGIKVCNGEENSEEGNDISGTKMKRGQSTSAGAVSSSGKRKTWKSQNSERNPIQSAKEKTDSPKNSEEHCKELSVSVDGNKKSPVQVRKLRSEGSKDLSVAVDKIERSPVGLRKLRSESLKEVGESGERIEKNSAQLRKVKSDSGKVIDDQPTDKIDASGNGIQLRKSKYEPKKTLDESENGNVGFNGEIEKNLVESNQFGSNETLKEFGVCQEKAISSSLSNVKVLESTPKALLNDDGDDGEDEEDMEEEDVDEEIEVEIEKKSIDVKEICTPEQKPKMVMNEKKVVNEVHKLHFERKEENKFEPISLNVKKQPPIIKRATVHSNFAKSTSSANEYHSFPETHNRLQSFVDLIMWKDISRSVFFFGIGTFIILLSSYTKDINISFISVISYLGLVYLAGIFLFRSIICRGVTDIENSSYVVGVEEATWLLKLILPYLNEFLMKLKALFSGDPSTTMKLAVLLFVLARCGSFITVWKMAKLGFFGVFTVPKVCSLYSTQITAYAKFWVRRFRDAWDSCSHKKAVTIAVFLLFWNLSSIVARIWAAFMLFVAFRYYQQKMEVEGWAVEDETWHEPIVEQTHGCGPTVVDITKQKKGS